MHVSWPDAQVFSQRRGRWSGNTLFSHVFRYISSILDLGKQMEQWSNSITGRKPLSLQRVVGQGFYPGVGNYM